jgi:hypothetical protein
MFIPLDCETSGALPAEDYFILDVGVYFGPEDWIWLPVRHKKVTLEPRSMRVNKYPVQILDGDERFDITVVDKRLSAFIADHEDSLNRFDHQLAGFNVGSFDLSYLRAHMRRTYRRVHIARAYDLNSAILTLARGSITKYKHIKAALKWHVQDEIPGQPTEDKLRAQGLWYDELPFGPHHSLYDAAEAYYMLPYVFSGNVREIVNLYEEETGLNELAPVMDSETV